VTVLIIFFIRDNDTDEITNGGFAYATKDCPPSYPHADAILTTPAFHFD
jgi:hypothetical protein